MKILAVHNFYQQAGGEDQVFASETRMLESAGHTVLRLTETNDRVKEMTKASLTVNTIWNRDAYRRVYQLVSEEKPDIVHFHNTFPLLSPSCYFAARRAGAAVVQTLHNYRLMCPSATLLREGHPCEDCVGRNFAWPGIQHACYRGSRVASAGVAAMLAFHRAKGTWARAVDAYIALTEFSRSRFIAGGLPPARLFVKPNFSEWDPGVGPGGDYFLYAGRLSPEKGLSVLLDAWRSRPDMSQLKIIGDGPLAPWLRDQIRTLPSVKWLGRLPREEVIHAMQHARALILPSIWYENFPVTVVEAYATGLPVIGSDAGTLPELIRPDATGLIFRSGDAHALAVQVKRMSHDPALTAEMRRRSRIEFLDLYREDRNCRMLLDIYKNARSTHLNVK